MWYNQKSHTIFDSALPITLDIGASCAFDGMFDPQGECLCYTRKKIIFLKLHSKSWILLVLKGFQTQP